MKKILILNGHPYDKSLCAALAQKYQEGAENGGFDIKLVNINELKFNPILEGGYTEPMALEPDLEEQQELIKWCDHLVIVTPNWWYGPPALLKGYFDRVLLPGFAFKYGTNGPPTASLKGRSARVIYTQCAPFILSLLFMKDSFWTTFKTGILGFCGFSPIKRTVFDSVAQADQKKIQKWLDKVYKLGLAGD